MITLTCLSCHEPVGEISETDGAQVRIRCKSRHCIDRPRMTWRVERGRAVRVAVDVDRSRPAPVT